MAAPCGDHRGGHRHTVTRRIPGPPTKQGPRRATLTDRCNSAYLWCTMARAVLMGAEPTLDGKPFTGWTEAQARSYLIANAAPNWLRGVPL